MSDDQNDLQTDADAKFPAEDSAPAESAGRGNGVAWLAVLLSAIALLAAAYTAFENRPSDEDASVFDTLVSKDDLDRQAQQSAAARAVLGTRIEQIELPDYSDDIAAVRHDLEEQVRLLNSLPPRVAAMESSVAALAGISAGARATFLLAEAEYYLQIGNAQLQLANNPQLAAMALGIADERINQLSDPALTAIRGAIADERAALAGMQRPDLEGTSLKLASLARVVDSLPLASAARKEAEVEAADTEQGGIERAWGSVKNAMSGLVKVTPPDQAKLELLTPDAEYFLRNSIALQLRSAQLALLRGEQAIFEQTLDDTSALLDTYFDTNNKQVASAKLTIREVRENVFTSAAPDISRSLRLLRQHRTVRESGE